MDIVFLVLAFAGGCAVGAIFRTGREAEKAFDPWCERMRELTVSGSFAGKAERLS